MKRNKKKRKSNNESLKANKRKHYFLSKAN